MNVEIKEPLKELRAYHKRIKESLKPISQIAEIDPTIEKLSELKEVIDKTLSSKLVSDDVSELLGKLRTQVAEVMEQSASAFGQIEAAFISQLKEQQVPLKELDSGWRIESLELRLRRNASAVALYYNHEPIQNWTAISSAVELKRIFDEAKQKLESFVLDKKLRDQIFWDAYEFLAWKRQLAKTANPSFVPVKDFYRECSVAKFRTSIGSKKKEEPLSMVAFLRNVDEYVRDLGSNENAKKLAFQSGSQAEQAKGIGVTIGGLNPKADYRTICFVTAQRTENGIQ